MGVTRGKRDALRLRTEGMVRVLHHETVHAEQFLLNKRRAHQR